ncbi:MAG: nitroreductase/quinone reductase family protein, partial [Mycobacterium sp.]
MSNDSAADIRQARRDWMAKHRELYLRSGGTEGHVVDITEVGGHAFTTHCLIRLQGRKSGLTRITPLIYGDIGGEVVVVASKGGAD